MDHGAERVVATEGASRSTGIDRGYSGKTAAPGET
jgi:hypothetical protein